MKKVLLLLALTIGLSSCATIFTGTKQQVVFDSNIKPEKPITLTVDGQKYRNVTFPYAVKVKKGFSGSMAKAESEGYTADIVNIDKKFNAVSIINVLWFLGFVVDAATGAMMTTENNNYEFTFTQDQK